ncbi:MAG: hypothetical protein ALECFALPRED_002939 [Alectoria fallacina]|uniref:Uncharacterized protein n=1 Tax=Alectoria fallacina TaxID=1903189 RepID=A0A8H3EIR0_9LECA|nr:MAG: hypothetical protein ALECFALPRED_002939 [Alectoria fallacina]
MTGEKLAEIASCDPALIIQSPSRWTENGLEAEWSWWSSRPTSPLTGNHMLRETSIGGFEPTVLLFYFSQSLESGSAICMSLSNDNHKGMLLRTIDWLIYDAAIPYFFTTPVYLDQMGGRNPVIPADGIFRLDGWTSFRTIPFYIRNPTVLRYRTCEGMLVTTWKDSAKLTQR